jgi:hypothetical protein
MFELLLPAAITPNSVPDIVGALKGCWKAPGQVRGKNATSVARGEWHLGRRYFVLHLKSVPPALGLGAVNTDGFSLDYKFKDAVYHNSFQRVGEGLRWTIIDQPSDNPQKLFARYDLTPASCRGLAFGF